MRKTAALAKMAAAGNPVTLEEWQAHIRQLKGTALWSKAAGANSPAFVSALEQEGYTMREITLLFTELARQFIVTGQKIPEGGLYDLVALAEAPEIRKAPRLTEKQVEAIQPPTETSDEVDLMLADLEQG